MELPLPELLARPPGEGGLRPRLQSSLALRADGGGWLLVNASPDLPRQVEACLSSPSGVPRASPIKQVFLTNADLDHALGLLLLREGPAVRVVAPNGVREVLGRQLRWDAVLDAFCGVKWIDPATTWQRASSGTMEFCAVPLAAATPPRFGADVAGCHGVGLLFREVGSGEVVGVFPDVAEVDEALEKALRACRVIFFDGTFWQDDEMKRAGISDRTARQMGHVPVSRSMPLLAKMAAAGTRIYYLHLNNTNPLLDPASAERRTLEEAGLHVARMARG